MKHRPWRELFERLPPEAQVDVKKNTAQVLARLLLRSTRAHKRSKNGNPG